MTITELAKEMEAHDRYEEFLDDLVDHNYPQPDNDGADVFDANDQFEYFWRRVAAGEDLSQSNYVA